MLGIEAVEAATEKSDIIAEVTARRAVGVAERLLGRPREGLAELDAALERATGDERLTALVRTSRAACLMSVGEIDAALTDVNAAIAALHGVDRAIAVYQRASITVRLSGVSHAIKDFDEAIPVFQRAGSQMYEAHARMNRGLMNAYCGNFVASKRDLERARTLYQRLGIDLEAAKALSNLAFVTNRCGEVIPALRMFEEARSEFSDLEQNVGILDLDSCEVLLAAGLAHEALERADAATASLEASGDRFQVPEAQLIAALACLQLGMLADGAVRARAANDGFRAVGRAGWCDLAEVVAHRCSLEDATDLEAATALVGRLDDAGLINGADQARLLVGTLLLRIGRLSDARDCLAALQHRRVTPDVRLGVCELAAQVGAAAGDRSEESRWLERGMRSLERAQTSAASTEIRWSVAAHARGLLRLGRRRAVREGRAGEVFRWIERGRMTAQRAAPLEPPADPQLAQLLGELRLVLQELREPPDADAARHLDARRLTLQQSIARRERALQARLDASGHPTVRIADVQRALVDQRLVMLDSIDGRLIGVIVTPSTARLVDLGSDVEIISAFSAANLSLNRLARGSANERLTASTVQRLDELSDQLDAALRPCFDSRRPVIVSPPAALHGAAWGLVPALRTGSFCVAPSATMWTHAAKAAPADGQVVLIAGAQLRDAAAEVRTLERVHPMAVAIKGSRATASRVVGTIDGASIAHFATHHNHRRENPLFGSIELADGPLFLHDLLRVRRLPRTVVLSACEGAEAEQGGSVDDLLGASTVLMERGTSNVIASPVRVADSRGTARSMVVLHEHLARGDTPADALLAVRRHAADASRSAAHLAASFSCFGCG